MTMPSLLCRFVPIAVLLCNFAIVISSENRTPQPLDSLKFGGNSYLIHQSPMLGYWSFGEDEEVGKVKAPHFDIQTSGNWAGYKAVWTISDSKLFLKAISGKVGGIKRRNADLLVGKSFPVEADWFSGKIEIAVGGPANDNGFAIAIIQFHIDRGLVKKMSFVEEGRLSTTWNGLDASELTSPRKDEREQ